MLFYGWDRTFFLWCITARKLTIQNFIYQFFVFKIRLIWAYNFSMIIISNALNKFWSLLFNGTNLEPVNLMYTFFPFENTVRICIVMHFKRFPTHQWIFVHFNGFAFFVSFKFCCHFNSIYESVDSHKNNMHTHILIKWREYKNHCVYNFHRHAILHSIVFMNRFSCTYTV